MTMATTTTTTTTRCSPLGNSCSSSRSLLLLRLTLLQFLIHIPSCFGWTTTSPQQSPLGCWTSSSRKTSSLLSLSTNDNNDSSNNHDSPMDIVRSLQDSFYNSATLSCTPRPILNSDGTISNLPLWRMPWQEVPGRSNILHVHEGMYTNMFETILRQEGEDKKNSNGGWLVGHLYLPKKKRTKNKKHHHPLRAWNDPVRDDDEDDKENDEDEDEDESAVLGTLLRIVDYRRLVDGRLILLVQAMERFVVTEVQQDVPYGMATVQLLPDLEEVDDDLQGHDSWVQYRTELDVAPARALALQESFQKWQAYEYEDSRLPLPLKPKTRVVEESDIVPSALVTVLPFVPYSSTIQAADVATKSVDASSTLSSSTETTSTTTTTADIHDETTATTITITHTTPTLERRLIKAGILWNDENENSSSPPSIASMDPTSLQMSANELEFRLWWRINDYLKTTKTPVSPILLGLLPPISTWEKYTEAFGTDAASNNDNKSFVLHRIAQGIQEQTELHHKYVAVDESYPALRRQKRLSYTAAHLLENPLSFNAQALTAFRQALLQMPSTQQRLALVYSMLRTEEGAFQ